MDYELIIVGGGPAGAAGGVYAARKQLRTLLITKDFGGQSVVSTKIENWIGAPAIAGSELAQNLKNHLETNAGEYLKIKSGQRVGEITVQPSGFVVKLDNDETFSARSILYAAGANRRRLDIPGADRLEHKGITYCASCDGPLFANQEVAVIGGGNAGFETALQLLNYCAKVTLLHHGPDFKADPVTIAAARRNPKFVGLANVETLEITGDKFVDGLRYRETTTNQKRVLAVSGVFVEIGLVPNTEPVQAITETNAYGAVIIDPTNQRAKLKNGRAGIWAAGDCAAGLYHQNNIAAGDAVRALEDIYLYLRREAAASSNA